MLYLTFYGSVGGCFYVKVNVGSDPQIFKHTMHVSILQN